MTFSSRQNISLIAFPQSLGFGRVVGIQIPLIAKWVVYLVLFTAAFLAGESRKLEASCGSVRGIDLENLIYEDLNQLRHDFRAPLINWVWSDELGVLGWKLAPMKVPCDGPECRNRSSSDSIASTLAATDVTPSSVAIEEASLCVSFSTDGTKSNQLYRGKILQWVETTVPPPKLA